MTTESLRPDPDAILASLKTAEARASRGRLKIFFGMCPGVGKTFSMLRAAKQEAKEDPRVVVGIVETHGRVETEALLEGLTLFARRSITHRGTVLTEMDLDGILAAKPRLVLVDELAHSNAPDSRHPKRWQDVVEILDAGIDVYSTLNVQHVESRADAVRQITGATVHETVPDSVIDLADELELVDLTPEALLERLDEGKVYLGDRAAAARANFFKNTHLAALRELALRYTAERVDGQLRALRAGRSRQVVWRSGERLLVAVGASPFSTQLVRWTRRLASAQGAAWIAVHVESARTPNAGDRAALDKNLALARELGAEVVLTHDDDLAAALVRVAVERNATQIVIGKPRGNRLREALLGGSLVDRLVRRGGNIDIYVVPAEPGAALTRRFSFADPERSAAGEYRMAAVVVAGITLGGWFLPPAYYLSVGLVYLLGVIAVSLKVGRGPVLLAGLLSALSWDYFFIPPRFTFAITKAEDLLLFGTYFFVAVIVGQMTGRIRSQSKNERLREEKATALFHLTRALAEAKTLDDAVFAALRQLDELFSAQTCLLIALGETGELEPHFAGSRSVTEKERGVIDWVFLNRKSAGRFTDTLPGSSGFYLPMVREEKVVGVLGITVGEEASLNFDQRDLLEVFARQLALVVERESLREAGEREKLLQESEKLHRTLFDSVSHELRTPLAVISSATENLSSGDPAVRNAMAREIATASKRLNRIVGNLLDQTRLESGALRALMDWCDAGDVINAAVAAAGEALDGHPLDVSIPDDLPPIRADFALTEQALVNLLLNAAHHTPSGTPIFVTAGIERGGQRSFFTVADQGPGLPEALRSRLFRKFSRGDAAHAGGLGLGLSIVRGFIAAQGGEIVVGESPDRGAVFTIYLSHSNPQVAS